MTAPSFDAELPEEAREFIETAKILAEPYSETIAQLRAVIAATATDVERYVADRLAAARQENAELRADGGDGEVVYCRACRRERVA